VKEHTDKMRLFLKNKEKDKKYLYNFTQITVTKIVIRLNSVGIFSNDAELKSAERKVNPISRVLAVHSSNLQQTRPR
jgi:hypothetical protein